MTENEAIKILQGAIKKPNTRDGYLGQAVTMAIQALEKVQQYEAIGTVEEFKMLKDDLWKLNEICKDYSAIGTVEEFKALKEKSVAKKVIRQKSGFMCPTCGSDCPKYEIKPRTNSERIRLMSDEELADFLINFKNVFGEEYEGQQSCLQWLLEEG